MEPYGIPGFSKLIFENITNGIVWFDNNGAIVYANPIFLRVFYLPNPVHKAVFFDDLPFFDHQHNEKPTWGNFFTHHKNKREDDIILGYKTKSIQRIYATQVYYLKENEEEYICLVLDDISLAKSLEKELDSRRKNQIEFLNSFPSLLTAFDTHGIIKIWNKQCEDITGYTVEEIVDNPNAMSLIYPDNEYRQAILNIWGGSEKSIIKKLDLEITCKDGAKRIISWTIHLRDTPIVPGLYTWGVGIDRTEEINAKNALIVSEERFNTISKATNDAVWDFNLITNELFWNDGITQLFGHAEGEIEETIHWWENHIHEDDRERVLKKIYDYIDRREDTWIDEYRFKRKDDSYAFVHDKGLILKNYEGIPVRMIGGIQDITDKKLFEDNLVLKNQQLEEYAFYNSHKVRAPLARLMGLVYLLQSGVENQESQDDLIKKIGTSAEELDVLIKEIANLII